MNITSIEELETAFVANQERQNDGLFGDGEAICAALAGGLSPNAVYKAFRHINRMGRRTPFTCADLRILQLRTCACVLNVSHFRIHQR